jgi:pimeloyl-ACP methyl ester carboxylesterase
MTTTREMLLPDGRRLVVYDAGDHVVRDAPVLLWHHGSPHTGALFDPLLEEAVARGIRLVAYARPGYGASTPNPGRDVASGAADVRQIADALGIRRFLTMGASGGGPHALACAALLPDRVIGAACFASPAPYTDDFDWFAGMAAPGALRTARAGRDERETYALTDEFDEATFTAADWAMVRGRWAALGRDAVQADRAGPRGLIDDDVATTAPWGFEPSRIAVPVLLVQGGEDRMIPPSHGESLAAAIPSAEVWRRPRDGHVSILDLYPDALDWLLRLPRP